MEVANPYDMPITLAETHWHFEPVAHSLKGELMYECKLCNAIVRNRMGHAEYHLLKGEKPAE